MSGGRVFGERVLRVVMLLHPARFRREYAEEMLEYYRTVVREKGAAGGLGWRLGFLWRSVVSAAARGIAQRLGGRGAVVEDGGANRRAGHFDTLSLDARYAFRSVVRRPRFAVAVVGVLALGMGANTAVFGVLNGVLLRPLPYASPDRLVRVYQVFEETPQDLNYVTAPAFVDLSENARSFEAVAAIYSYSVTGADLTGGAEPVRVRTLGVTPGYFEVLGIEGLRGRPIAEEHAVAGVNVVVLSAALAESRDAGPGGSVVLDGVAVEVLGVLPRGFEDPLIGPVDVLVPLVVGGGEWEAWQWGNHYLTVIARMAPGVTIPTARVDVERRYAAMTEVSPSDDVESGRVVALHDDVVGEADGVLAVLMGAVAFLLLVACVNVASLFLARGTAREGELAVRSALGSPRWRVVRQLMLESLLLSAAGAAAGLLLGRALSGGLVALAPFDAVGQAGAPFDFTVFGFSFMTAVAAGIVFGLLPALSMTRIRLERSLRQGGRGGGPGVRESRTRDVLVVAQLALSLMLLIGAGLLVRSFQNLRDADLGFATADVVTFEVNLPSSRYDADARIRFHDRLREQLLAIPGVRTAAAVSHLPVTGRSLSWGVTEFVDDPAAIGPNMQADQRTVQGDYFDATGIPVLAGRTFRPEDDADAPPRVVISESLADRLAPDGRAIGRRLRVVGAPHEIIGVVGDAAIDVRGGIAPIVYHSHRQFADNRNWSMRQVVALEAPVPGLLAAARQALASIDPALVLYRPAPLHRVIERGTASDRFATFLLSSFAAVAVLLAAVGVYGVLAYSVSRRRHEIGVRMALGARATDVRRMVVRRGAVLAVLALAIGTLGALALSRTLSALLFGVGVRDPLTFAAAAGMIATVALLASWVPAISATQVDPVSAFRSD